MTKKELAKIVFQGIDGVTHKRAEEVVETFFNTITDELDSTAEFKFQGFGTFKVKKREARKGRNPHTGETIDIAAKSVVTFKPSSVLTAKFN